MVILLYLPLYYTALLLLRKHNIPFPTPYSFRSNYWADFACPKHEAFWLVAKVQKCLSQATRMSEKLADWAQVYLHGELSHRTSTATR